MDQLTFSYFTSNTYICEETVQNRSHGIIDRQRNMATGFNEGFDLAIRSLNICLFIDFYSRVAVIKRTRILSMNKPRRKHSSTQPCNDVLQISYTGIAGSRVVTFRSVYGLIMITLLLFYGPRLEFSEYFTGGKTIPTARCGSQFCRTNLHFSIH